MKKSLYIFISFSMFLVTSCKKKVLPGEDDTSTSTPVFYAKCSVNGLPLNLEAGANDYYMSSSYYQDTTNVYVYKAELKQQNCTTSCSYALTILINDAQVSAPGSSINVAAGLKAGTYIFNTNDLPPVSYLAQFTAAKQQVADDDFTWVFDDGSTQKGYSITRAMDANKLALVELDYHNSICSADHMNIFNVGNPLQTNISAIRNADIENVLNYQFMALPTGQSPYKYSWDFGDNIVSSSPTPSHTFDKSGRYNVKLQLVDARNDTCLSYYQLSASHDNDCAANYTSLFTPIRNTKALSTVTILVTDMNGTVYSSKDYVQSAGSSFEIVSVDDYKTNDQGQPTKKIKLNFSCTLKNGSNSLILRNGQAVIAVAYK